MDANIASGCNTFHKKLAIILNTTDDSVILLPVDNIMTYTHKYSAIIFLERFSGGKEFYLLDVRKARRKLNIILINEKSNFTEKKIGVDSRKQTITNR